MEPNDTPVLRGVPKRIMFVCLGNICRSPAAEGVLNRMIREAAKESRIQVDSAGTASYHIGRLPDPRMIATAARRGYELTSRAKAITKELGADRDLILAMDRDNYAEINRIVGGAIPHLEMFSDYLDSSWPRDVPDPYYGNEAGFEYVIDMLEAAAPRIIKKFAEE